MRVYLRKPVVADAKEFVKATKKSEAFHRPWVYPTQSEAGYGEYLERIQNSRHVGYFVCLKSDDRIAGVVNLSEIVRGALQSAYVGYWAVASLSGQGYMREGLSLVFAEAFVPFKLHRLEVNIQPGNEASIRLVKGLGLRKEGFSENYLRIEGQWRDHERWALTCEDWQRSSKPSGTERLEI